MFLPRRVKSVAAGLAALACCVWSLAGAEEPGVFEFGIMGDAPYHGFEERAFDAMLAQTNRDALAFVIHVGDFKSGSAPCTDALFQARRALFDRSEHPFILLFGDNEWTDCEANRVAGTNPLERLSKLREIFAAGDQSLGRRTLKLERQSENAQYALFREHVRWEYGRVLFVGLNIPGSDNNWGDNKAPSAEYVARNAATVAWLQESFALAKRNQNAAVVVGMQADPSFSRPDGHKDRRGFEDVLGALTQLSIEFVKPVLLLHGDTHWFRVDKPLRDPLHPGKFVENFTRVETFGSPFVHWVKVRVDVSMPNVFTIKEAPRP